MSTAAMPNMWVGGAFKTFAQKLPAAFTKEEPCMCIIFLLVVCWRVWLKKYLLWHETKIPITDNHPSINSTYAGKEENLPPPPDEHQYCMQVTDTKIKNATVNKKKLLKCLQTVEKKDPIANINTRNEQPKNCS